MGRHSGLMLSGLHQGPLNNLVDGTLRRVSSSQKVLTAVLNVVYASQARVCDASVSFNQAFP